MAREEWEDAFIESAEVVKQIAPAARAAGVHRNTVGYHTKRDQTFAARVERALGGPPRRPRAAVLLVLLLSMPLAARATVTSSPVQLGEAGLDLVVGLRRWQESSPNSWPTASTAGVTVVDLGDGAYIVSGLPLATGLDRYQVTIAVDEVNDGVFGEGDRALYGYSYGSAPGTRLIWLEELSLPSAPTVFKQGDSFGSLSLAVRRRLPAAVCEPETTAAFTAANAQTNAALFTDRAATISNCTLDGTTGTYGATLTYDLQSGDTATAAKYVGEFKLCYSPSSCQTLPVDNRLRFEVVRRLGG